MGLINAAPLYRVLLVDAPTKYHSVAALAADADGPSKAAQRPSKAAKRASCSDAAQAPLPPTALTAHHLQVLGEHSSSHVELGALAAEMGAWTRARNVDLLHLAVQWPLRPRNADVVCSPYGCGSVAQVEQVLAYAAVPLPAGIFEDFDAEFEAKVAALGPEKHFYWFKKQTAAAQEWEEMGVYPRTTWGHAMYGAGL